MDRPVALAAAETHGETSPHVAGSSRGYFELLPDEGTDGCGGSRQRQHQSSAPTRPRLSRHELSAAEGAALGRHKDRIRRFSESRVECALLQIVVQNLKGEGLEQPIVEGLVSQYGLASYFTPKETAFIGSAAPSQGDRTQFSWRYEAAWVLLWALGYLEDLG